MNGDYDVSIEEATSDSDEEEFEQANNQNRNLILANKFMNQILNQEMKDNHSWILVQQSA